MSDNIDNLIDKERRNILVMSSLIIVFNLLDLKKNASVGILGLQVSIKDNIYFLFLIALAVMSYMLIIYSLSIKTHIKNFKEQYGKIVEGKIINKFKAQNVSSDKNVISPSMRFERGSPWYKFWNTIIIEGTDSSGPDPGNRENEIKGKQFSYQFIRAICQFKKLGMRDWWYYNFPRWYSVIALVIFIVNLLLTHGSPFDRFSG